MAILFLWPTANGHAHARYSFHTLIPVLPADEAATGVERRSESHRVPVVATRHPDTTRQHVCFGLFVRICFIVHRLNSVFLSHQTD